MDPVGQFEEHLGHSFANPELLRVALTHSSKASERSGMVDNERLEFLGDAVLQLFVTEFLFTEYPTLPEGQMAKVRASVVNRAELAKIARQLEVGGFLELGRGEEASGGRDKESILADAIEAVLGAVYLDSGPSAAQAVVVSLWEDQLRERVSRPGGSDYKTRVQELLAAKGKRPFYRVEEEGPDHDKVFQAEILVEGQLVGSGRGRSKKEAEQAAAGEAIDRLG